MLLGGGFGKQGLWEFGLVTKVWQRHRKAAGVTFSIEKNVKNAVKSIFSDWQKEASFLEQIFNKASDLKKEGCKVGLLLLPAAQRHSGPF